MLSIFGVRIDDPSPNAFKSVLEAWLQGTTAHAVFTPNPEFLLTAHADQQFVELLNQSDLSLADGIGLRFAAAALTDERLIHRQTGIDTLLMLAHLCAMNHQRLLLLGGMNASASDAARVLTQKEISLDVVSLDPGFLPGSFLSLFIPDSLIEEVNKLKPDVIAVALGQGRQERFIMNVRPSIPTLKIAIGVGGAFDTISGRLKRAPEWMRRHGFEWLWRFLIEPKRIKRIFRASIVFPIIVICDTLKHRKFLKAFLRVINELRQL